MRHASILVAAAALLALAAGKAQADSLTVVSDETRDMTAIADANPPAISIWSLPDGPCRVSPPIIPSYSPRAMLRAVCLWQCGQ